MNPPFQRLFIVGAGGSGRETAWLAREIWGTRIDIAFVVDDPIYLASPVHGYPVLLLDAVQATSSSRYVIAIGDGGARRRIAERCDGLGWTMATLVHPNATISDSATLGDGSIVYPGVSITTDVTVGRSVHVNAGCTISHDGRIGDYATLSPGVHLAGHVHVGADAFVGVGANVINGTARQPLTIGQGAVVAAGACVVGDVPPGAMVAGVPAARKR